LLAEDFLVLQTVLIYRNNNSQATAGTISTGVYNKALIAATTDQDYYKFTATTGVNITVTLTTLPFDYDLQLLNSAGTVIGSSAAVAPPMRPLFLMVLLRELTP
jgi:hypothetical protein